MTWTKGMNWTRLGAGDRRPVKRLARWAAVRWFSPASPTAIFPVIRKRKRQD